MLGTFAHLCEVGDAQNEAYGVQDVRLPSAIQSGDGIEERVDARNIDTGGI